MACLDVKATTLSSRMFLYVQIFLYRELYSLAMLVIHMPWQTALHTSNVLRAQQLQQLIHLLGYIWAGNADGIASLEGQVGARDVQLHVQCAPHCIRCRQTAARSAQTKPVMVPIAAEPGNLKRVFGGHVLSRRQGATRLLQCNFKSRLWQRWHAQRRLSVVK